MTAIAPMVTMLLAWSILRERATTATVVASVVGALGVVLLVLQGDGAGHVDLVGLLASVGAVTSASAGFVLTKRWSVDERVLVVTTWQARRGWARAPAVRAPRRGAAASPAAVGLVGAGLPRHHRLRRRLRRVVQGAGVHECRRRRRHRTAQPRLGHRPGRRAPRRTLRTGAPARALTRPRQRRARPAPGPPPPCVCAFGGSSDRIRRRWGWRADTRGGHPAYGGRMPINDITLTSGTQQITIPQVGFGVWQVPDDEVDAAVLAALETGYRHIDTAKALQQRVRRRPGARGDRRAARRDLRDDQGVAERVRRAGDDRLVQRLDGPARARDARPVPPALAVPAGGPLRRRVEGAPGAA